MIVESSKFGILCSNSCHMISPMRHFTLKLSLFRSEIQMVYENQKNLPTNTFLSFEYQISTVLADCGCLLYIAMPEIRARQKTILELGIESKNDNNLTSF